MSSGPDLLQRQQLRLAGSYTLVMAGMLCLFALIGYEATRQALLAAVDTDTDVAVQDILPTVQTSPRIAVVTRDFRDESAEMAEERGLALAAVTGPDGRRISEHRTVPLAVSPDGPERESLPGPPALRVRRVPLIGGNRQVGVLVVATHWTAQARSLSLAARHLGLAVLAATAGGAVLAYWLAALTLRPVRRSLDQQRQFLADAAHELRTPVAIIQAQLDTATGSSGSEVATASRQARRLGTLVDDLLTLARFDAAALRPQPRPFRLDDLLEELVDDYRGLADDRQVLLKGETGPPVTLVADPEQIRRLLANVLDNALRHTPAGGTVTLRCQCQDDAVTVQVIDTGVGIPQAVIGRIFDRFFHLDEPIDGRRPGAGLGLAIARSIAEAHGGRLTVVSEPGQGSTFALWLPGVQP